MAEWFWFDVADWKKYPEATAVKLEKGFVAGLKEIKVDDQRFVEIAAADEIRKNFLKLPADFDKCVGMQRRYDDEQKRRIVKREVPQFFSDDTFYFAGLDAKTVAEVTEIVNNHGGLVSGILNNKITVVVLKTGDVENFDKIKGRAHDWNIDVVTEDYVFECVAQNKRVKTDDFIFKPPKAKEKEKEKEKEKKKGRKHKGDDSSSDEEDNKRKKKKRGRGGDSDSDSDKEKPKKAKSNVAPAPDVAVPAVPAPAPAPAAAVAADAPALVLFPGMTMMGVCTYVASGDLFPQLFMVDKVDGGAFEARLKWPTLNDAETKCRGKIDGAHFSFEEYEIIKGVDDVEVPATYTGEITGTSVIGKIASSAEETTFKLDCLPGQKPPPPPPAPAAPAPVVPAIPAVAPEIKEAFKEGAKLTATLTLTLQCTVTVRDNGNSAVIEWPECMGGYKTTAKVVAEGSNVVLEEHSMEAGSKPAVAVPRQYRLEGNFAEHAMKGKAFAGVFPAAPPKPEDAIGDFTLKLQ